MKRLGIGLIGLGRHGSRYANHLLHSCEEGQLVAVCRRDQQRGQQLSAELGVRFYADYRELVADPAVEAVVVVTPPSLAPDICHYAVKAGKPLLIEKPLARTAKEARGMVEAARAVGVPLMTAQTLRFDRAVVELKEHLAVAGSRRYLIVTNRIEPRPEVVQCPEEYGGRGVLLEIGIHSLDLVRFLTGEEVVQVYCEMEGAPETRAFVSLRTAGGLPCLLDVSRVTAGRVSRAEWIGEDGQLVADWVHHRLSRLCSRQQEERTVEDCPTIVSTLTAFLTALREGRPMPITGEDGLRAVELVDACYQSARTNAPVTLRHL